MNQSELQKILEEKKIQPTAMRMLTLRYIVEQPFAVSLNDVEHNFEMSDRVTLYRTLKTFEQKGVIHSIKDGSLTKYALCKDHCSQGHHADAHLHFTCMKCHQTICLPKIAIPSIDLPNGFSLEEADLMARGLCADCSSKTLQ